jgi:hypothetical protein
MHYKQNIKVSKIKVNEGSIKRNGWKLWRKKLEQEISGTPEDF